MGITWIVKGGGRHRKGAPPGSRRGCDRKGVEMGSQESNMGWSLGRGKLRDGVEGGRDNGGVNGRGGGFGGELQEGARMD